MTLVTTAPAATLNANATVDLEENDFAGLKSLRDRVVRILWEEF
jgi:hypothetical protein